MTAKPLPPRPTTAGTFLLVDGEWVNQFPTESPEVLTDGNDPAPDPDGEKGDKLRGQPDGIRD
jgi:hypothetical protein